MTLSCIDILFTSYILLNDPKENSSSALHKHWRRQSRQFERHMLTEKFRSFRLRVIASLFSTQSGRFALCTDSSQTGTGKLTRNY